MIIKLPILKVRMLMTSSHLNNLKKNKVIKKNYLPFLAYQCSPAAGRYNPAWVSIENLLVDYVCQDNQFLEYVYWTSVSVEHFQTNDKKATIS